MSKINGMDLVSDLPIRTWRHVARQIRILRGAQSLVIDDEVSPLEPGPVEHWTVLEYQAQGGPRVLSDGYRYFPWV